MKKTPSSNNIISTNENAESQHYKCYDIEIENENQELEKEIINNTANNIIIRNYDQKIIKDIKIKEKNSCYVTYPCLHDVIIIFDDNTYEDTTMSIVVIYEIWKKRSFDINIKFLKHCKDEYNKIGLRENIVDAIFLNKYTII
jgi:hypothetical protein